MPCGASELVLFWARTGLRGAEKILAHSIALQGKRPRRKRWSWTPPHRKRASPSPEDETFDVGLDTRTGVAMLVYRHDRPFALTGTIDKLIFNLEKDEPVADSVAAADPTDEPKS
jgi:hypothetical protein